MNLSLSAIEDVLVDLKNEIEEMIYTFELPNEAALQVTGSSVSGWILNLTRYGLDADQLVRAEALVQRLPVEQIISDQLSILVTLESDPSSGAELIYQILTEAVGLAPGDAIPLEVISAF